MRTERAPWDCGGLRKLDMESGMRFEPRSVLLACPKDMDPVYGIVIRVHKIVPVWNPMSILSIALLSIILTVADLSHS